MRPQTQTYLVHSRFGTHTLPHTYSRCSYDEYFSLDCFLKELKSQDSQSEQWSFTHLQTERHSNKNIWFNYKKWALKKEKVCNSTHLLKMHELGIVGSVIDYAVSKGFSLWSSLILDVHTPSWTDHTFCRRYS